MQRNSPPIQNLLAKLIDWSYWLAWGTSILSMLYLVASYGTHVDGYRLIHNSDASFIWVFYRDVLARGAMQGWELPTNPYLFPDMALFIPIDLVVNNVNLSSVLFGVAQLLLTLIGLLWLQREVMGPNRLAQTFTLLAFTLTLLIISSWKHLFYYFTIMPLHHFGVLVVMPYAMVFLVRALRPHQSVWQWLRPTLALLVLVTLTSVSDILFSIQFVVPALLCTRFFNRKGSRQGWRLWALSLALLLTVAISKNLRDLIVPSDKLQLYSEVQTWEDGLETTWDFIQWLIYTASIDFPLSAFWLSSIIALCGVIFLDSRRVQQAEKEYPFSLVSIMVLGSVLASIGSTIVTNNFGGPESSRYFLSAIYMPMLIGWPLFLATAITHVNFEGLQMQRYLQLSNALLAIVLLIYMLSTFQVAALAAVPTYQDPVVACLLQEAEQRNLRYGISEYWQANYLAAVTEGKLRVISVTGELIPDLWNSTPVNYDYPFEFVIINPIVHEHWLIQEETLYQKFGPPQDTFHCGDLTVYVYDRANNLHLSNWFLHHPRLARFDQVGKVAEFYGYNLASQIEGTTVGFSQMADDQIDHAAGALAHAPLEMLPTGSYALELQLFADHEDIGSWEVRANSPNADPSEAIVMTSQPVTQTGNLVITNTFTLSQEKNVNVVVKYKGTGTFYVDRLRLVRVDPTAPTFTFAQASDFAQVESQAAQTTDTIQLLTPFNGQEVEAGFVDFAWQWTGEPLAPNQTFEVRLWRKSNNAGEEIHYGAHDALASRAEIRQVGNTYMLRLDVNGAHSVMQDGAGEYAWSVALVTVEPTYQELGIEAKPFMLKIVP